MKVRYVLSDYVIHAMRQAVYEKLDDETWAGEIPPCIGVLAFAKTLRGCKIELRSVLEDWVLLGLRLKHPLPVIEGIDLNWEPVNETVDAVQATGVYSQTSSVRV